MLIEVLAQFVVAGFDSGAQLQGIKENVASEILGITFYDSVQCFGKDKVAELDTTQSTPVEICENIISLLNAKTTRKVGVVDWLSLVYEKGDVGRFLEYS